MLSSASGNGRSKTEEVEHHLNKAFKFCSAQIDSIAEEDEEIDEDDIETIRSR
jgi:hypothetical protein